MFSDHTMVSVNLKGTGVRPEVTILPADGLINFGNVLVGEAFEKSFTIKNVSSFPVNFQLLSQVSGVENVKKKLPFILVPSQGTIKANSDYEVKVVFQPDNVNNNFFDVLLIDIPNQVNAKSVYLRGQSYPRQMFIREHVPFEWRPLAELRRKYEDPLELFARADKSVKKQTILLEFMRDDEAAKFKDYPFKREQDRLRKILIGSCRLKNTPMEKAGAYELVPKVSN
jgi:hypothetical protein